MSESNLAIIQNSKSFFYNSYLDNYPFLDKQVVRDFDVAIQKQIKPTIGYKLLKLFNIYFYLNDINLPYIKFSNSSNKEIFDDFLKFITSDFITTEIKVKQTYRNYLIRITDCLNESRLVKIDFNKSINCLHDYNFSTFKDKITVINGVFFRRGDAINICLINYSATFGIEQTLKIYKNILLYPNHSKINQGMFSVFKEYIGFLVTNKINFLDTNEEILSKFIVVYFNNLENKKVNIDKYKQFWNDFLTYIDEVFKFNIDHGFLKIKTQKNNGSQTNIKTKNSKQVKSKLITDVPLEICDDKSIHILKRKVEQDIEIVESWAKKVISDYIQQKTIGVYPTEDFFTDDAVSLRTKYKMWREGSVKNWINNHFNLNSIFNKNHLFAIQCLLVINHPAITEQFLFELTQDSVVKTDNGTFLVGKKHRKGKEFSEQKILLNDETIKLVKLLVENHEKMRKFTQSKSLNLHVNPTACFTILELKNSRVHKTKEISQSISFFIKENHHFDEQEINDFINKVTFTKLRATCAMKEFFKHQSTKKMAETLGHEHYNPALLTHYLPEPIIHFYQSRWIRIFQKGIIYEAMKNSEFLLKAIGFKDMDTLDEFLKNHVLKNLPTDSHNNPVNYTSKPNYDECYVSINEENLTALLSIREAVSQAKEKELVRNSAFFWSDFTDKLISEINNNKSYYSFSKILLKSQENCNADNYKKVIYA
jgi:hypothetical protein